MIRKLVSFALNQRFLSLSIGVILVGAGIWAYSQLKIEAYPDVGDTEVEVIAQYPGRAAEEVEKQVTVPIERALNNVPHVISRRSKTIFGLADVTLTFEDGTNDYFARQLVAEKLGDADLPDGVSPEMAPIWTPVGEIFRYVITGPPGYSVMDLRTAQDWTVVPRLLQTEGISDVVNFGGLVKQFHVVIDPNALVKYKITLQQVANAIQSNNVNTGGNILTLGGQGLAVRGIGRITSDDDIKNIVVAAQNGTPIFMKDLASVEVGALPPSGILGISDKTDSINLDQSVQGIVVMRRGENPSEVLKNIKETVANINETALPPGVKLVTTYDRTDLVNNTLETVSHTLFEGVTIVIIVLIFFLGNIRTALIVALTIPLSLLFAFVAMHFTGIPANLLSLGAIDFGIIVDGAVVMGENIVRRISISSDEEKQRGILWIVLDASREVEREIFFSVTIIVLAYLPLFTLQRVEGKLFSPMAYTMSYAIGGSMLVALTLIPVLLSFVLKKGVKAKENILFRWMRTGYDKLLDIIVRYRYIVAASSGLLVIGALVLATHLGTEFLPELDEGSFNIRCFLPAGISLQEASKQAPLVRQLIAESPVVSRVITQLGRNDDGTDPYGPNRMEVLVGLKPYSTWPSNLTKPELLSSIKQRLESHIPGAVISFSQPILDNVTEAVTGSVADLAILINGDDLGLMRATADTVLGVIRNIPGASEYGIEQEGNQAQLKIEINRPEAARYGINVSDIQNVIEMAIGGKPVSKLYDGEKHFDIVVRYPQSARSTVTDIGNMLVPASNGNMIPLNEVCSINIVDGQTVIQREDGKRQISVRTNIRGRDQGGFVAEAQEKVAKAIHLPHGYSIEWGGQFENLERARNRLAVVIPITVVIIFVILFLLFKDIKYAAIVLTNVPFALIGGVVALMIRGMNFNVSAGVGFVSLFGVAVMSGVLLVSHINLLRVEEGAPLEEAVRKGSRTQLRPILMMMTVAMLGLIPAARATGIGSDVQRPLATVIVGGLASALILTLVALPAIYYIVEDYVRARERKRAQRIVTAAAKEERPTAKQTPLPDNDAGDSDDTAESNEPSNNNTPE
ncbi:MAG TPA: CusA/CzcA family heavy metal efflux RND transporter [Candidatus Kapabacteria bacterium]|nr:CusA/CzcA family heavy metal efflux RND transporter [Candidatus Kapabacteria bacterium]